MQRKSIDKELLENPIYKYMRHRPFKKVSILVVLLFLSTFAGIVFYKVITFKILTLLPYSQDYILILFYTVVASLVVLVRFPLAVKYDPSKYLSTEYEPTVSIIIPAYNEEGSIADTINTALMSNYPENKLEIFVVNDGSKDGTAKVIKRIADNNPRITFVNFPMNLGKREALYYGFLHAKGEIVVTIDSDTLVDKECIREIVKPFSERAVSGVCGHTDIKNQDNFYGRIQEPNYFVGFHLYKKSESLYGSVFCLSGCVSAYRRGTVLTFIDEWRNQRFLGQQCTFGEDRGLTTLMLRSKYKIVYTPAALAETEAPNTFTKLWKQRLRWRRSFFRETFWQSKFMYKSRPWQASLMFYTYSIMTFVTPFLSLYYMIILPILTLNVIPTLVYVVGLFLVSVLYTFYAKIYCSFPATWTIQWWLFNTFILSWGSIYAWATITNQKWLTR